MRKKLNCFVQELVALEEDRVWRCSGSDNRGNKVLTVAGPGVNKKDQLLQELQ